MDKNGTLTISNFQQGIADSPLLGFAKMNNIELFEKQGVAKMQFASTLSFNTTSLPVTMVYDQFGNQYVGCFAGELYRNGTLMTTYNGAQENGICDMKIISDGTFNAGFPIEYIIVSLYGINGFYILGPTYHTGTPPSYNFTSAMVNVAFKQISVGIDLDATSQPIIYLGNGNKIATIKNFAHVGDGSTPTLSLNTGALTLQPSHWAYSIKTIGKYLAIGTTSPVTSVFGNTTFPNKNSAVILWDRSSTSFNLPTFFKENGISSMLEVPNRLYVAVGNRGRIFFTDGTTFTQIKRLPFVFNRQFGNYGYIYPNASTLHNGDLLFGLSGTGTDATYGVYAMSTTPTTLPDGTQIQYPTVMRNSISTGATGATQQLGVGFLYSTSADQLYIGWQDGTTYGVDVITSTVTSGYNTVIYSPYYTVGSQLMKHTFKRMEISLTAPLLTGQSIRVSYRENLNDTVWKDLGTYDNTNFGTNNVHNTLANLASKVKIQFKIELNTTGTNNIELEALLFYSSEK